MASPNGDLDALRIHQDARIYLSELAAGQSVSHELAAGRHAWLQILRGAVTLNGQALAAGDGAALSDELQLTVQTDQPAEIMLFDLA
ncbi:MAG: hypothetical protein AB7O38_11900 [Pirellulaceae bacterium]